MSNAQRTENGTIVVRRAGDRGATDLGWLDSRHTFSFGDYRDPAHAGFRTLRVINDDRVAPAQGFGTHGHRDMEIVSYIVGGALEHRDSMGNGSVLRRGDVQRMSAGTGVLHSEFNPSDAEPVHFLQIWILPDRRGLEPGYEEKRFSTEAKTGRLRLIASPDGRDGSLEIHQDARLYACVLVPGTNATLRVERGRHVWVQMVDGRLRVNGVELSAGDGAAISDAVEIPFEGIETTEFLVFDLG